jgi:hypothetical protein
MLSKEEIENIDKHVHHINGDSVIVSYKIVQQLKEQAMLAIGEKPEPCKWCDGCHLQISKGALTTLWMHGNRVGVATKHEDNFATISYCPNCGRPLIRDGDAT